ncbi:MAG: VWA domain-containing protein [Oscillospiraceae bacterium]|nr:VWA domain-containing protein [Oscillospiraceae bacterium]
MGIISSNKSIGGITTIPCRGSLNVTIGITSAPDIVSNPTDIVLILDRSGSMAGQPLTDLKSGVNTFIDIIAEATGGAPDQIGSGSHIGIVSFDGTATQDTGLITSVAALKAAAGALVADGSTNHGDAFTQATNLLSGSTNHRVMVMFTDGVTTAGPDPSPIAAAARAMGITIYVIGLIGDTGIDENALRDWATDPDITHVAIAPTSSELDQIFADLAANITVPGATNIVINETLNPDFVITGAPVASVGTISLLTGTSFRWSIDKLGATVTQSATVTFPIQHIADTTGTKNVDHSLTYTDTEGNVVTFGNPEVFVNCEPTFPADTCPEPVNVTMEGCEDFVEFDAGDLTLEDAGRILQLDVNLLNVCPGRRVALAVVLTELENRVAVPRGMKTFTIPAHARQTCSDVLVTCIRFILPDDGRGLCAERELQAKFMAHYIDNDFSCCPAVVTAVQK